jgi:hypothetical protein
MSFDETEKFLMKPETQFVFGFGTLLVDFLAAKAHEILDVKPMPQEEARAALAEAAATEFDAFLNGQPGHSIDERKAGRSEVVDEIRDPKAN